MRSEISQTHKEKQRMMSLVWNLKTPHNRKPRVYQWLGVWEMGRRWSEETKLQLQRVDESGALMDSRATVINNRHGIPKLCYRFAE